MDAGTHKHGILNNISGGSIYQCAHVKCFIHAFHLLSFFIQTHQLIADGELLLAWYSSCCWFHNMIHGKTSREKSISPHLNACAIRENLTSTPKLHFTQSLPMHFQFFILFLFLPLFFRFIMFYKFLPHNILDAPSSLKVCLKMCLKAWNFPSIIRLMRLLGWCSQGMSKTRGLLIWSPI